MIKYNLKCINKHEFESWFSDSKEFDRLKKRKLIECIFCQSKKIEKSIMAPGVLNSKEFKTQNKSQNIEFVEKNFASKVREVYYDKNSKRNIYGITSEKEKEELKEEGIDLVSIPWIEKDN